MNRTGIIYALQDPISFEIRYIGKTIEGKVRYHRHMKPSVYNFSSSHVYCWIRSLVNRSYKPLWLVLQQFDNVSNEELNNAEIYWISYFKNLNCNLCNHTDGGDGMFGYKMKEETKEKLRNLNIGKKQSVETLKLRSMKLKGQKRSLESKLRLSQSKIGSKNPMFGKSSSLKKKVITECGLSFNSLTEASKHFNVTISAIKQSCRKNTKVKGLYKFNYM